MKKLNASFIAELLLTVELSSENEQILDGMETNNIIKASGTITITLPDGSEYILTADELLKIKLEYVDEM